MIVLSNFSAARAILAKECAAYLGLTEIPATLYEFGVNVSELPQDTNGEISASINESSLLSMGLVYSYNGTLTFINTNGHTMIMPDCEIIKEELRKCGYLICERGESVPEKINADEYSIELDEFRKKYTLSAELAQKVYKQERGTSPIRYDESFAYDVFSMDYYRGGILSCDQTVEIAKRFDLKSRTTRIILSFYHGMPSLTHPGEGVRTLEDYLLHGMDHDALSDRKYYSENGLFKIFSKLQLDYQQALERAKMMSTYQTQHGLDATGDLTDEVDKIVKP
ncbi:MAG: hypothetical protein E7173_00275 [Firmicutes bacterium]|nr:hypothetical protein [Bacillota bacterium]